MFLQIIMTALSTDCLQVSKKCHSRSNSRLEFVFSQSSSMRIPATIYQSRSPNSSSPSKFLPLSLPGAPSSAGFLDICEPSHVWMSRRNGATNPELHENRAEKVSPVYVNVTGQHPPGVRGSTTSKRECERDMRADSAPSVRNNHCNSRRE